uniref:Corrinoid adenosyltransferase MMAB n=1 Tax=Plectus sambesii TaxID=2011161 RepID=A0A914W093_9BILA
MALRRGWTVLAKVNSMHQSHCRALSATTVTAFKKGRGTGDQGQSGLFSNERRWKDDDVFEALGTTDELNSIIGMCREATYADGLFDVSEALAQVQCCLQDVAAHLATPPTSSERKLERTRFDSSLVTDINEKIDDWGDRTPALKTFILPGGGETGALLQYARSVCRRAERRVVPLLRSEAIDGDALRYLNRY